MSNRRRLKNIQYDEDEWSYRDNYFDGEDYEDYYDEFSGGSNYNRGKCNKETCEEQRKKNNGSSNNSSNVHKNSSASIARNRECHHHEEDPRKRNYGNNGHKKEFKDDQCDQLIEMKGSSGNIGKSVVHLDDQNERNSDLTKLREAQLKRHQESNCDLDDVHNEKLHESSSEARKNNIRHKLNLVVIGHVDAGKSTLVGNILFLTGQVEHSEVRRVKKEAQIQGKDSFFYAWIMDNGDDERSHGVTIDVSVRHIFTRNRVISVLDAPGHKDFIPNMIQGCALANVAILVVDAKKFYAGFEKKGQTREHLILARSLGINTLIVAVNKMDEIDYNQNVYMDIEEKLSCFLTSIGYQKSQFQFLPISAFRGVNILERRDSRNEPLSRCSVSLQLTSSQSLEDEKILRCWWHGLSLLEILDSVDIDKYRYVDVSKRNRNISEYTIDSFVNDNEEGRNIISGDDNRNVDANDHDQFLACIFDLRKKGENLFLCIKIEQGKVSKGDKVIMLPSQMECTCKYLSCAGVKVDTAEEGQFVEEALFVCTNNSVKIMNACEKMSKNVNNEINCNGGGNRADYDCLHAYSYYYTVHNSKKRLKDERAENNLGDINILNGVALSNTYIHNESIDAVLWKRTPLIMKDIIIANIFFAHILIFDADTCVTSGRSFMLHSYTINVPFTVLGIMRVRNSTSSNTERCAITQDFSNGKADDRNNRQTSCSTDCGATPEGSTQTFSRKEDERYDFEFPRLLRSGETGLLLIQAKANICLIPRELDELIEEKGKGKEKGRKKGTKSNFSIFSRMILRDGGKTIGAGFAVRIPIKND